MIKNIHPRSRIDTARDVKSILALLAAVGCTAIAPGCGDDDAGSTADAIRGDGGTDAGPSERAAAGAGGKKAASAGRGAAGSKAEPDEEGAGAAAGEGGSSADGAGTGGSAGAAGSTSAAGAGGGTSAAGATVTGVVVDVSEGDAAKNFDPTKYPALAGVKVCVYEKTSIPCATTDASGKYSLGGLPESLDAYLTYEKESFAPTLFKLVPGIGKELPAILLSSSAYRDSFAQAGGIAPDAAAGLIYFSAQLLDDRGTMFHQKFGSMEVYYLRGFTVSIAPAAQAGPVYVSSHWQADATLTQSSAAGWGIIRAAPGDYTLTYDHPSLVCPPVTTKVVRGFTTTYASVVCSVRDIDTDAGL